MDTDKNHDMIDYNFRKIPPSISMATASGLHHHNVSRSMNFFPGKFSGGYGIFPDTSMYDGGMINNNIADSAHDHNNADVIGLNSASSSGPMMMANLKRALPMPYWPVGEEDQDVSPSKRFHGGGDCSNMSSSMIEESTPQLMQQQGGVLGDGLFRTTSYQLPGLNWYSS